jgi:DNA adenine methylase Dam
MWIEPPFNYTGSKFKLLNQLVPLFDKGPGRFVDLFSGGGSVYANVAGLYQEVVANDIIADLVSTQRLLLEDPEGMIARTRALASPKDDQQAYLALRASYNSEPTPEKLWALMLCCTNNMMRFNRDFKFNQTWGKRSFNERTEEKARGFASRLAPFLPRIKFSSVDFGQVEPRAGDMTYIDPPYSNTEAGYNAYWKDDDDLRLLAHCKRIGSVGSKFCVSGTISHAGERCRLITSLVDSGFTVVDMACDYNKVSRQGYKETREVAILNYPRPEPASNQADQYPQPAKEAGIPTVFEV